MTPVGARTTSALDRERLRAAAQALEALVLKQVVSAAKAFTGGEGAGSALRADLFAEALAEAMVKGGGIGLARQIERSVLPPGGASGGVEAGLAAPDVGERAVAPARALKKDELRADGLIESGS